MYALPTMNSVEKQDCQCDQGNLHLHLEIENLKQRLLERERHIVSMETNFLKESEKFPNGEYAALVDKLKIWQDKYSRLFESHRRIQKVNQGLEDKLLQMVDRCETNKSNLQADITLLTEKLIDQQTYISKLHEENEMCRNDLNIALQLLQCKPSNFIPQRFDMLPPELQVKVRSYIASKQRKLSDSNGNLSKSEMKTIKVPIPTFPPTAMVYSLNSDTKEDITNNDSNGKPSHCLDIVSTAIMAKILKERERERTTTKHCQSCTCMLNVTFVSKHCQTNESYLTQENSVEEWDEFSRAEAGESNKTADLIDLTSVTARSTNDGQSSERDLISFEVSPQKESSTIKGPRHCSVRLQPGSNNILLDNAAQFSSPVLYKRRSSEETLEEDTPVHRTRGRRPHRKAVQTDI